MLFWFIIALMTGLAILAVLVPLRRSTARVVGRADNERAVYRDQLVQIDKDRARGLIDDVTAEAARGEIARRLIKSGEPDPAHATGPRHRRLALVTALLSLVAIPAVALGLYSQIGAPDMPDQPLEVRLAEGAGKHDINAMVAQVEAHLAKNPDDVQGLEVIAPIYMRLGRYRDAAEAYRRQLVLGVMSTDLQENYGEALVAANEGLVTADAQTSFEAALMADENRIKSRYYIAEGLAQAGKAQLALDAYDAIIARSPADAPWLEQVYAKRRVQLAELKLPADTPPPPALPAVDAANTVSPDAGAAPGPTAEDVAAAQQMTEGERQSMIEGMVAQLAGKLEADPNNLEGWQRLIRAYVVLKRTDDAKAAFGKAKAAFAGNADALAALDATAGELNLVMNGSP